MSNFLIGLNANVPGFHMEIVFRLAAGGAREKQPVDGTSCTSTNNRNDANHLFGNNFDGKLPEKLLADFFGGLCPNGPQNLLSGGSYTASRGSIVNPLAFLVISVTLAAAAKSLEIVLVEAASVQMAFTNSASSG